MNADAGWFLILGEDENDRLVLKSLCEGICPGALGRIKTLGKPVPKLRDAGDEDLANRAKDVAAAVAAEAVDKRVVCVLVHEDLDAVGQGPYLAARTKVQAALDSAFEEFGLTASVHAVIAVEETEAWLLLYPDVLHGFRKDWEVPSALRGIDTGLRNDPKSILKSISRKSRNPYRERDAPLIAKKIVSTKCASTGTNASWSAFCAAIAECCWVESSDVVGELAAR